MHTPMGRKGIISTLVMQILQNATTLMERMRDTTVPERRPIMMKIAAAQTFM